jgi:hypothetical protein
MVAAAPAASAWRIPVSVAKVPNGVTIFTIANSNFVKILHNFHLHMATKLPAVPFETHAVDRETFRACQSFAILPQTCSYSPIEDGTAARNSTESYYENPIYMHKVATLLEVMSRSLVSVLLDATSLVSSPPCLLEWLAYPEDIVGSTGWNPGQFSHRFGWALNTGAVLFRRTAIEFIRRTLWQMRRRHYSGVDQGDQLYINFGLMHSNFTWSRGEFYNDHSADPNMWDRIGVAAPIDYASVRREISVRFLSPTRWPRHANASDGRCLFHPYVHEDREGYFRSRGFWYLDNITHAGGFH